MKNRPGSDWKVGIHISLLAQMHKRKFYVFLAVLTIILFLNACTKSEQPLQVATLPVNIVNATATLSLQPEATQGTSIPTEEPIHFTFPTPASPPVSLWRPPQYSVPFALSPFDHFYFSRPIDIDDVNWPLADYRYGGVFFGTDIIHTGIDLPNPKGTSVIAAAGGKVIWAGNGLYTNNPAADDPYGLAVVIRHDFGYQGRNLNTVYAHLDRVDVVVGQLVKTGEHIGNVGITGATTGPHLHFEIRIETNSFYHTRNPELWLAPPEGWGVLVGKVMKTSGAVLYTHEVSVTSFDTGKQWTVYTYGGQPANSDDYYHENMVLSDLPAGKYQIKINYDEETYLYDVIIYPGAVSYFTFQGSSGYSSDLPVPVSP